jgi:hypothetical protein
MSVSGEVAVPIVVPVVAVPVVVPEVVGQVPEVVGQVPEVVGQVGEDNVGRLQDFLQQCRQMAKTIHALIQDAHLDDDTVREQITNCFGHVAVRNEWFSVLSTTYITPGNSPPTASPPTSPNVPAMQGDNLTHDLHDPSHNAEQSQNSQGSEESEGNSQRTVEPPTLQTHEPQVTGFRDGVNLDKMDAGWKRFVVADEEEQQVMRHIDDLHSNNYSIARDNAVESLYVVVTNKWMTCKLGCTSVSPTQVVERYQYLMGRIDYFFQVKITNNFKRVCLEQLAFWMFDGTRQFNKREYFGLHDGNDDVTQRVCMRDLYCMHFLWLSKVPPGAVSEFYNYFRQHQDQRAVWVAVMNLLHTLIVATQLQAVPDVAWVYPMGQQFVLEFEG